MEQVLDTPLEERRITEYAGFWIRVAAVLIDSIILAALQWVLLLLVVSTNTMAVLGIQIFSGVLGVAYYTVMESSEKQATLGKIAVGIKVGDADGNRISWPNALGRYFSKLISTIILFIGFIMVAFDDKKQGLHDKIASTYVFYSK